MIRVIHVITSPDGGGAERLVRELTALLPDFGIDSRAIYFQNPRGVELSSREQSLELSSVRSPVAIFRLRRALQEFANDGARLVVHAHLTWPLYFSSVSGWGLDAFYVYTEHSTKNKRRGRFLAHPLEKFVYGRYQRTVCISTATKTSLDEWLEDDMLGARMSIIVNGSRMLPMKYRVSDPDGHCQLVSIGSLNSHKGFDLALRAVYELGDRVSKYTIVGEGPERDRLESLVRTLGLTGKVYMPGYCPDVLPYLLEADLCVIPSRWEGFGLVAVEALSTGLPLVAANVPGLREVVSPCDATRLAEPDDVESIQKEIEYALDNFVGNADVSESARARAELFTIGAMVSEYSKLYRELADG